jgi:hypothetical protein
MGVFLLAGRASIPELRVLVAAWEANAWSISIGAAWSYKRGLLLVDLPLLVVSLLAEKNTTGLGLPNRSNQTAEPPTHESASFVKSWGQFCAIPLGCVLRKVPSFLKAAFYLS